MAIRADLRPRTRELYGGLLRRSILPTLGDTELRKLSPSQVRAWNAGLPGAKGSGASTAAKAYRLLRAIMNTAVADEMILRNPCQIAKAGVERARERPVATVAQVSALADAILPRFRVLVLLAAWCGLRRGELLALQRGDLDLERGTVRVERSMQQLIHGELVVGPPNSDAGQRVVAVPPHLMPELRDHLEHFAGLGDHALVFTGEKGGPVRPHVLQKAWEQARQPLGLGDFHFHDLRHTGNTWAASTGASTKELMARMGHSTSEAAIRYQHATSDRDHAIAVALSKLADQSSLT